MKKSDNTSIYVMLAVVAILAIAAALTITYETAWAGCKGEDCQTKHKHFPDGRCKEKEFPANAQANGWDDGPCHGEDPTPEPTDKPKPTDRPTDKPKPTDRPTEPPPTEPPPTDEPTPEPTDHGPGPFYVPPTPDLMYQQLCDWCSLALRFVVAQEKQADALAALAEALK